MLSKRRRAMFVHGRRPAEERQGLLHHASQLRALVGRRERVAVASAAHLAFAAARRELKSASAACESVKPLPTYRPPM